MDCHQKTARKGKKREREAFCQESKTTVSNLAQEALLKWKECFCRKQTQNFDPTMYYLGSQG